MTKKKTRTFKVTLDIPEGATISEVKDYIEDAVSSMKDCYSPEDDIFYLDGDSVKVKSTRKPKPIKVGKLTIEDIEKSLVQLINDFEKSKPSHLSALETEEVIGMFFRRNQKR